MSNYIISMDVSGDVDDKIAEERKLLFIPMEYSFKDDMRLCKSLEKDSVLKEFYDGQRGGALTKTTQINPYLYEQYFEEYLQKGTLILYLSLSSGLSTTFASACEAKKALKEKYPNADVYVLDTLAATGGMGVLCERASRNREKGMSIAENYDDLIQARKRLNCWFMVQDLMYLKRGGRISASTAVIGSMLNIRPILKIDENGKLVTVLKKRGNSSAINELSSLFCSLHSNDNTDCVYVIDADEKKYGDMLEQQVKRAAPTFTVRRKMLSPIIGAHTGPGMVAVCFLAKEK